MSVRVVVEKVRLTLLLGEPVAVRVTVPAKEPWLIIVITEVNCDFPFWLLPVKKLGLALILIVCAIKVNVTRVWRDTSFKKPSDVPLTKAV